MMLVKNRKKLIGLLSSFLLFIFIMPVLLMATTTALIDCNIATTTGANGLVEFVKPCNFNTLVETINRIIDWIISIAGVIFTISAIYGGFLYMTSGDNPGNKTKAKSILWSTLSGFVIILVSWLIVYTILKTLAPDASYIFKFIGTGN